MTIGPPIADGSRSGPPRILQQWLIVVARHHSSGHNHSDSRIIYRLLKSRFSVHPEDDPRIAAPVRASPTDARRVLPRAIRSVKTPTTRNVNIIITTSTLLL
ncbi:hypothetical protein EVAR_103362_1 [Eumeta japonica]|uniref:Uncharacterized protein n=1 Tax=Eumeta variegata TaxID=151549 RepID=A0A4C1YAB0_EUMVA|nr:hypothetical protein EVAR_103362_1 [Eumeta japonica]